MPNLELPIPSYSANSLDACVIIPIFWVIEGDIRLESHVAKSAAWALRSWREFTDAEEHGIDCKLYIERRCYDIVRPILDENNVQESDIIISDLEMSFSLGKCITGYYDHQFDKYNYLVIADSDVFIIPYNDDRKLRFFETLLKDKQRYGIGVNSNYYVDGTIKTGLGKYWWINALGADYNIFRQDQSDISSVYDNMFDEWIKRVAKISNPEIASTYMDNDKPYIYSHCPIRIFHMPTMSEYAVREWFTNAINTLSDDEAVISLWRALSENPIGDPKSHNVYQMDSIGLPIHHPFDLFDSTENPMIYHATDALDWMWQTRIGAKFI